MTTTSNTSSNTRLDNVTRTYESRLISKNEQLLQGARSIIRRMERTIEMIEGGFHVNSLGELQGSAAQFDIMCAEREQLLEVLTAMRWAGQSDEDES